MSDATRAAPAALHGQVDGRSERLPTFQVLGLDELLGSRFKSGAFLNLYAFSYTISLLFAQTGRKNG